MEELRRHRVVLIDGWTGTPSGVTVFVDRT
jgi:hypothetical protein